MSNIDKQSLRQLAVDAKELAIIKRYTKGIEAHKKFIAVMTPATVLALLDELEAAEKTSAARLGAIDTTHKMFQRERDRAEKAEKRIAELERDETQLIEERDSAEKALADMYEAAMGERPEWSNLFGYAEAIDDVAQHINFLDLAAVTGKGE